MNPGRHAAIHQHGRLAGTLRASGTDSWAFTYAGGYAGPPVSLTLPVRACPITLAPVAAGETFSPGGLRSLHPRLTRLEPLALSQDEQLLQARLRADKMSIQGVQPKLSAVSKPGAGCFEVVDSGGRFILKPNPSP